MGWPHFVAVLLGMGALISIALALRTRRLVDWIKGGVLAAIAVSIVLASLMTRAIGDGLAWQRLVFTVVDKETGVPIPGAVVRVINTTKARFEQATSAEDSLTGQQYVESTTDTAGYVEIMHRFECSTRFDLFATYDCQVSSSDRMIQVLVPGYSSQVVDLREYLGDWVQCEELPLPNIQIELDKE